MTSSDFEPRLWRAPEVNPAPSPEPLRLTAERIEALEAEVREAAQEAGFKEGLASGKNEFRSELPRLMKCSLTWRTLCGGWIKPLKTPFYCSP